MTNQLIAHNCIRTWFGQRHSRNLISNIRNILLRYVYNTTRRTDKKTIRITSAEEYIIGKYIDQSVADSAANIAVTETLPLLNNRYKIQIAKTLVKRAIWLVAQKLICRE